MAKLNHQKRSRPRPVTTRRRRTSVQRAAERQALRALQRYRRG